MIDLLFGGYKKAFQFSGRERRKTYGIFVVVHFIVFCIGLAVLAAISPVLGAMPRAMQELVGILFVIAWLVPFVSMLVRRFHDNDSSGWLVIPGFLVFAIMAGAALVLAPRPVNSANRYGPDPREA